MQEIWKDIIIEKNGIIYDYTGLYQVSNLGRVRSLDRTVIITNNGTQCEKKIKGKEIKLKTQDDRYVLVQLCKDGKIEKFTVHRLVAVMFISNPDNLPIVNHKDENKQNNCVSNLEWCDASYNTQYSLYKYRHKLKGENHPLYGRTGDKNPNAKKVICLETKQVFNCIKDAQEWLGKGDIAHCLAGRSKSAGGYHWQYYNDYKKDLRKESDVRNTQLVA